jgi:hypothetical protein
MKLTYEEINDLNPVGVEVSFIRRSDGAQIPIDPANSDYQAYLNKDKPVEHFTPSVTNGD